MPHNVIVHITPTSYRFNVEPTGMISGTQISIDEFCRAFTETSWNPVWKCFVIDRKYRHYDPKTKMLFLPRYDLDRFKIFCQSHNLNPVIKEVPLSAGVPITVKMRDGFKPKDDRQRDAIEFLLNSVDSVRGLAIQPGAGKALLTNTPVKIPGGWKTIGELNVGDQVTAPDGTPTTVLGVYPQGVLPAYEVTSYDGRKVIASGDHLWWCYYHNTCPGAQWQVRTTDEMRRLLTLYNPRVYLPLIQPELTPDVSYVIPPYAMGYLLGNGGMSTNSLKVSTIDSLVLEYFQSVLPERMWMSHSGDVSYAICGTGISNKRNPWIQELEFMNLMGRRAYEKFIPEIYMKGSPDQRWELLQGFMDSDGYAGLNGSASYTSTSQVMAEQIQYIVRSLGDIASMSQHRKKYTYKGKKLQGRTSYNVNIISQTPSRLFKLPRKKDRMNDDNQYAKTRKLRIRSIEPVGDAEMVCIKVDRPDGLFVVNDFIVTHNTVSGSAVACGIGRRTLIIVPGRPGMLDQWKQSILDFTTATDKDVYTLQGNLSIAKLLKGIDKTIKPAFILASIGTVRSYMKGGETYENFPPFDEFCNLAGIGIKIVDEAHENFHANLMIDLRWNMAISIPMTATFDSANPTAKAVFDQHYPLSIRFGADQFKKYVDTHCVGYGLNTRLMPNHMFKGQQGYAHVKFEDWLLRKGKQQLAWIMDCVYGPLITSLYINKAQPGEKLLILCLTHVMVDYLVQAIAKKFPDKTVTPYISETEDQAILDHDIIVSTPGSAGTGRDIKNLRTAINTISVRSSTTNVQNFGRLREMKDGSTPIFAYVYCYSIPSQQDYAFIRKDLFEPLSKNFYSYSM